LRLRIPGHIAGRAFHFAGNIFCRTSDPILVHRVHSLNFFEEVTGKARSSSKSLA
jgi:hypothetical protein